MGTKLDGTDLSYEFTTLIYNGKVKNLTVLDLVVQDEFGEPFFYSCQPVELLENVRLFDNELNFDMQRVYEE